MSADRCPRCLIPRTCLCARIPTIQSRIHFIFIRHATEGARTSNTARMAHLALSGSELYDHGDPRGPVPIADLLTPDTWRLDSSGEPWDPSQTLPRQLLVLDGSWPQVRRMLRRLPVLHGMRRFALPPPPPRVRMRLPPPEGMSTLEAVATTLRLLEGDDSAADALLVLYDEMTKLVLAGSGKQRR